MIQLALGGYKNVRTNNEVYDAAPAFYEPGFNLMAPVEMGVPESDQIYVLLRKRTDNQGLLYDSISKNDFSVSVTDITTGENVPAHIEDFNDLLYGRAWNKNMLKIDKVGNDDIEFINEAKGFIFNSPDGLIERRLIVTSVGSVSVETPSSADEDTENYADSYSSKDITFTSSTSGLILSTESDYRFRIGIDNSGNLTYTYLEEASEDSNEKAYVTANDDIEITDYEKGVIVRNQTNEDRYRITLEDNGFDGLTPDAVLTASQIEDASVDEDAYKPLVLVIDNSIDIFNPVVRARVLNCTVKSENNFVNFRLSVEDESKPFHYIQVKRNEMQLRPKFSTTGSYGIIKVSSNDNSYVLFSPFAYLKEVNKSESHHFSYPVNSVYYYRQISYNEEGFYFQIYDYSHDFIPKNVSVLQIPFYDKTGVMHVDRYLYTEMQNISGPCYIDVKANAKLSDINIIYRFRFVK